MSFSSLANEQTIAKTVEAVSARGVSVEVVDTRINALARVKALIPAGSTVQTGASLTLREIGFEDLLVSKDHPWQNLKDAILAEKDPARQTLLRRQATLADYFLGSVHAISQTGEIVVASMTGSQLGSYAYAARNVIWVAGAQKITATLDEAIRRVREYVLPHEDERMRKSSGGKMGSMIGKLLIFEREAPFLARRVTLLLVKESLGD